jgi:formiminoglutamase
MPILVSVPHGGSRVPEELRDRVRIGPAEVLDDGDAYTGDIYNVADQVRWFLKADVARAFVDLNRAEDDRPPGNPDGVVKSHTAYSEQIYQDGREPDAALVERLLSTHYRPYHELIKDVLKNYGTEILVALDCHSMAAYGPDMSPDPGMRRPVICLGNRHGQACPRKMMESLSECFQLVFGLDHTHVTMNRPFAGGYTTRTYGMKPVPWIQVEISRDLYLRPPYFDRESLSIDPGRLRELNSRFLQVLRLLTVWLGASG